MKKQNIISLMGEVAVVTCSLLLFLHLLAGLGKYDNISSGGTDGRVWLEPGGLNNEEIGFMVFLSISLLLTGYPLWCYFWEMKYFAPWKDFLALPLKGYAPLHIIPRIVIICSLSHVLQSFPAFGSATTSTV